MKSKDQSRKSLIEILEQSRDKIGRERDKLRDLKDEIDSLFENCEQGVQLLDDSISTLSEQC